MKPAVVMFYLLGVVVFFQLLTGGLRVFGFIGESSHITAGFITFFVALATLIVTAATRPWYKPAIGMASVMVFLIFIQGLLGFDYLDNGDPLSVITVHYTNALIIYGLAISGVWMATRWSKMTAAPPAQAAGKPTA